MRRIPFFAQMGLNVRLVVGHPAGRLMGLVYIISAVIFVLASGDVTTLLIQLGLTTWGLLTMLIAVSLTRQPAVAWEAPPIPTRTRLWLQLTVVLIVIGYTLFRAAALRSPELENVPILGAVTAVINRLHFNIGNPLIYILPTLVLLLLLGARPSELGLSLPRSAADWRRSGLIILVLAFVNIGYILANFAFGGFGLQVFGRQFLNNPLQNGFSEEFLMRGALMTRLIRVSNVGWGIVISSLIFGLWHFSANLLMFEGNVFAALTFSIISQSVSGVVYAVAMQRTGNLLAPSITHVLSHFNPI